MEQNKWDSYHSLMLLGIKSKPCWFNELAKWGFSEKDIEEIEEFENYEIKKNEELEKIHREFLITSYEKQQRELVKEMLNKKPEWVTESKIRYFNEKITELEEQIKIIYEDNFLLRNEKVPLWFRQCLMRIKGLYRLEKDLRGAKMRLRIAKYGSNDNDITPEMIAEARKYPIERLCEIKKNRIKCIWHAPDLNPSMYYFKKTNSCFCFSCGKFADSISIAQKKYNMNFVETIKFLNEK